MVFLKIPWKVVKSNDFPDSWKVVKSNIDLPECMHYGIYLKLNLIALRMLFDNKTMYWLFTCYIDGEFLQIKHFVSLQSRHVWHVLIVMVCILWVAAVILMQNAFNSYFVVVLIVESITLCRIFYTYSNGYWPEWALLDLRSWWVVSKCI